MNGLCSARRQGGRFEETVGYGRRARPACRQLGDPVRESIALNNLAIALDELGRFEESVQTYEEAIAISRAAGDGLNEAMALMNAGDTYLQMGRRDGALGVAERAQVILRGSGHSPAEMSLLDTLGDIHSEESSRLEEADNAWAQAQLLHEEQGDHDAAAAVAELRRAAELPAPRSDSAPWSARTPPAFPTGT
ncbi:tetratricopeptide repeat protein [Streptomyces sp. NPDC020192]|uniref:tetratricopeptide repeat protein n=1 Tax=Streptomyces sp. NPDC020192 TaxID=3365066 RepID=UPI00378A3BCB